MLTVGKGDVGPVGELGSLAYAVETCVGETDSKRFEGALCHGTGLPHPRPCGEHLGQA